MARSDIMPTRVPSYTYDGKAQKMIHLHELARRHHAAVRIREDVAPERRAFRGNPLLKNCNKTIFYREDQ